MSVELRSVIVGSHHKPGGEDAVARLREGDPVELRPEPENPIDPGAIAVYVGAVHTGYIPRKGPHQAAIRAAMDHGDAITATVSERALVSGLGKNIRVAEPPRITVRW